MSAAYLGLSRPQYPFVLRLRRGEQIPIAEITDLKAFWQIFLRRIYRVDPSDRVILDLGANVGVFTLYAARSAANAKIFAVEPFPSTFRRLAGTIHNHNLDARVACLNFAAAGSNGMRNMPDTPVPSQRRALVTPDFSASDSGTRVMGKTLETILEEHRLRKIDLLKIDIEGSEYEVMLSTSAKVLARINRIALEYHGDSAPYSRQQLFDHLHRAGFTTAWDVCDARGYGVAEMIRKA
jgi:FkbM family methyltransferase